MKDHQGKKNKSLSLIEVDPTSINKNQLNNSSSKMQYSIPKTKRWNEPKLHESHFYDIPSTKSQRSASFGYGKKVDIGGKNFKVPSVGTYSIKSQFTGNPKKGITMSAGREVVKNNSLFGPSKKVPGPGNYQLNQQLSTNKGYTMGDRLIDLGDKWTKQVPGPGNYQTLQILDKNLRSHNSRIKNIENGKFSRTKRKSEFEERASLKIPGPAQYANAGQTDKTTKFPNQGGYKFSHSSRKGIVEQGKQKNPGPGSYQFFSEFLH